MRKIFLFMISLILILGAITGCSKQKEKNALINKETVIAAAKEQDLREVAYNQLKIIQKDKAEVSWQQGKLSKITLKEGMGNISDKSYIGKEIYIIDFPTNRMSVPNNIIVFLSMDNNKIIGFGYVD